MAYIRVLGKSGALYELADRVVIGRGQECQIVLDDSTISGSHASIEKEQERFKIVDLDSTNGVQVNDKKVQQDYLAPGCIIRLGAVRLEFLDALPSDMENTQKIRKTWIPGLYLADK